MLNSKVYRACKNAQQRMIGMLDIGLPTPFYTNVTTELKGFVSAFIPNDRCDRLQAFYKKINEKKKATLTSFLFFMYYPFSIILYFIADSAQSSAKQTHSGTVKSS